MQKITTAFRFALTTPLFGLFISLSLWSSTSFAADVSDCLKRITDTLNLDKEAPNLNFSGLGADQKTCHLSLKYTDQVSANTNKPTKGITFQTDLEHNPNVYVELSENSSGLAETRMASCDVSSNQIGLNFSVTSTGGYHKTHNYVIQLKLDNHLIVQSKLIDQFHGWSVGCAVPDEVN